MDIINIEDLSSGNYIFKIIHKVLKDLNILVTYDAAAAYQFTCRITSDFTVSLMNVGYGYLLFRNLEYLTNQKKVPVNFLQLFINKMNNQLVESSGILYRINFKQTEGNDSNDYSYELEPL